jgi:hypothetical protein
MAPRRDGRARGAGARPARFAAVALVALAVLAWGCLPSSIRPTPIPTPTPTPTASPQPTPTPTPPPPTPTPGPTFKLHTVVRGDSLGSLARKYQTTARSIAYWNREQYPSLDPESADYQPNRLDRGWVLRVLPGEVYVPPPDDGETGESPTPTPPDEFESLPPEGESPAP